jgi:predicted MFS family arabinose efflux permease
LRWAVPALRGAPMGLAAALVLVRFADEWAAFLPAGSMEPMRRQIGLSYAEAGAVLAALPAGGLLGNVFIVAADRVSRRLLASLGAIAYAIMLAAFGAARSFEELLVASFLWGAASDAFVHGAEVALVDLAGPELPPTLARMHAWAAVGDLLGPATIAAFAFAGLSWRGPFFLVGVAFLAYAGWIAAHRLPPPHPAERDRPPLAGVTEALKDPGVIALALILGLFSLLDEPLIGFLIAFLEHSRHLAADIAVLAAGAILAGQMLGYAAFERLVGRAPGRRAAIGAAIVMTASLPPAIFAPALGIQAGAGAAFGAAGSIFYTTMDAIVLSRRPGQAGAVSAVVGTIGMAGLGFPVLAGLVADRAGLSASMALYAAVPLLVLALTATRRE